MTFPHIYVYGTDADAGAGLRETFVVVASKKPLDLENVGVKGEPVAPPLCLSATGDTVSEPEPSLVRFFLRKPSEGIGLELLRFLGLGVGLDLEEMAESEACGCTVPEGGADTMRRSVLARWKGSVPASCQERGRAGECGTGSGRSAMSTSWLFGRVVISLTVLCFASDACLSRSLHVHALDLCSVVL